jgi:hypothetical protein
MGKLAVPEYILNKPGRLTESEFEKMKLHASVGADILSAIDFPYPVVPIVRHHHESWDGSGYPDGLRGTEIPIGARILSVVDCFDALTSDRPYRRRLSNEEALQILNERKGNMYDPWVVQTFEQVYERLDASEPVSSSHVATTAPVHKTKGANSTSVVGERNADIVATERIITLECEALLFRLRPRLRATVAVFFRYESNADELVAHHVASIEKGPALAGLRIARGHQLTGWVAANRQSIVNSDPALDLGDAAGAFETPVKHTLSMPICWGKQLIGVLSIYGSSPFSPDDEQVCREMVDEIIASADPAVVMTQPVLAFEPAR